MLTFEDRFESSVLACFLWADEPTMKRVRFGIGSKVLQDVLHGGNPVHDDANKKLCENERSRIEAARAERPSRPGQVRASIYSRTTSARAASCP
jgi:hypothetical protein